MLETVHAVCRVGSSVKRMLGIVIASLAFLFNSPANEPFFFIQLSDPQFGMFTNNADFAQESANFAFAVATINRLQPAFVVVTGDLVNKARDAAQLAEYKRLTAQVDAKTPVYNVVGNHDVGNEPDPTSLAAWKEQFGPDHYAFRYGNLVGIVLNSNLISAPQRAPRLYEEQEKWLREELGKAKTEGAEHIVVFQHHPWFVHMPDEPNSYWNIPLARRSQYLALFHESNVKYLFSGHYHRNAVGRDGDIEAVTTGAVGKPLGDGKSGLRIVVVSDNKLEHRFYDFGELPSRVDPRETKAVKTP